MPRSVTEVTLEVRAVEVPPSELERLVGGPTGRGARRTGRNAGPGDDALGSLAALAAERPGAPEEEVEGEAVPSHLQPLGFAAFAGGDEVLVGQTETLAALTLSWGSKPVVAHDWKATTRPSALTTGCTEWWLPPVPSGPTLIRSVRGT